MSKPNEIAEAVLIVIKRLAKWISIGALGIGLLYGLGFGAIEGHKYITQTLPRSEIKVEVKAGHKDCSDKHPFLVTVKNGSSKTINSIEIRVSAHKPGHSTDHAEYNAGVNSDMILMPGEGWKGCKKFRLKYNYFGHKKIKDYDWSVRHFSVDFQS